MIGIKIIHLLNSNGYSGAENVVCQIISMFEGDAGIEMAYCSPDGSIREALQERQIHFIPLQRLSPSEVRKMIREQHPDVIHAHDFRASIVAGLCTRGIPIISHLHNNSPWLKKRGAYSYLYAFTCKRYMKILTVSDSVFDEYVFGERFRGKLDVIGNPIQIQTIQEKVADSATVKQYDLGFCGRLTPQKKPEAFVEIVANVKNKISNITAAMIGDGEQREEIAKLIQEKHLEGTIQMLGYQKNPYPLMKSFKIMCMPSRWEGFGLAAVEALALGVPVVCSNVGGLPKIVNDACGKVCNTVEEMAATCEEWLLNEPLLREKGTNALKRARELDNYAAYKQTLTRIYRGIPGDR